MKNPVPALTQWQKRQATLLYYFASLDYLKNVKTKIDTLIAFSTATLDKASEEDRDADLRSARWGERDTSQNWGNNAWAILADFQRGLAEDIANRSVEVFDVTGRNHCARALAEFSMEWTTPEEQARFDQLFDEACDLAFNIDQTMNRLGPQGKWTDYSLTMAWEEHSSVLSQLPKLRVRNDVFAETGTVPVRTGVYVCADDPNASLQFAWTGGGRGTLLESNTMNTLGLAALAGVGRSELWVNGNAMAAFVKANLGDPMLRSDSFFEDSQTEDQAPSLVARQAFTSRPCRWFFVEMIHGERDDGNDEVEKSASRPSTTLRFEAGFQCPVPGFYFTPAKPDSRRYFKIGEIFPDERSVYGATIWQLDDRQE